MKNRSLIVVFLLVQCIGFFCGPLQAQNIEKLKVGIPFVPPLIWTDNKNIPHGLHFKLFNDFASKNNILLELKPGTWEQCLSALEKGEIDVLPIMTKTPDRTTKMEFPLEPVCLEWSTLFVRRGEKLESVLDLSNKKIGLMAGDKNAQAFEIFIKGFSIQYEKVWFKDYKEAFAALNEKKVAGVVCFVDEFSDYSNYRNAVSSGIIFAPSYMYFAFRKGSDAKLMARLSDFLKKAKVESGSAFCRFPESHGKLGRGTYRGIPFFIALVFLLCALFMANYFRKKWHVSQLESIKKDEKILHFFDSIKEPSLLVNVDDRFSVIVSNKAFKKEFSFANFAERDLTFCDLFQKDGESLIEAFKSNNETGSLEFFLSKTGQTYSIDYFKPDSDSLAICFKDFTEVAASRKLKVDSYTNSKAVLQRVRDCLFFLDSDLRIVWANNSSQEIFGMDFSEMQFRRCNEIICKSSDLCAKCPVQRAKLVKEFSYSSNLKVASGHIYSVAASPQLDDEGNMGLILVSVTDITELEGKEERQRQIQKMEVMGSLAGGIAHDFNNILQAVLGYAELMVSEIDKDSESANLIESLIEAGIRGQNLVRQMMFFSRRETYKPQRIEICKHLKQIIEMVRRIIGENYKIDFSPPPEEIYFVVDPTQFDQIITNLCVNARDAMKEKGTGTIHISVNRGDLKGQGKVVNAEKGKYVVISVSDQGTGIPKEIIDKIFTPFFTTKKSGEGTGMGLASVHGIVKRHKGKVEVESKIGEGTTFRVILPVSGEVSPVAELVKSDSRAYLNKFSGKKALLAEDEPSVRLLSERMLKKLGFEVISVANGREAFDAFKKDSDGIDILVFDVIMPELNGKEAYEKIIEIRKEIPIIFCTGYNQNELPDDFLDQTDSELLKKPFSISDMGECIARHIDIK